MKSTNANGRKDRMINALGLVAIYATGLIIITLQLRRLFA